jgi:hypothetical protein
MQAGCGLYCSLHHLSVHPMWEQTTLATLAVCVDGIRNLLSDGRTGQDEYGIFPSFAFNFRHGTSLIRRFELQKNLADRTSC